VFKSARPATQEVPFERT